MPDWSRVRPEHVRSAIAEHDRLGDREFAARYRFGHAKASTLWHGGREYDPKSIAGLAYLHATGQVVAGKELLEASSEGTARALSDLGFDVVVDEDAMSQLPVHVATPAAPAARRSAAPRTATAPRKAAAPRAKPRAAEPPAPKICPTCYMALPATGICDNCD